VLGFALGSALALFGWFADPDPTVASNYAPGAGVGYLGVIGALLFGLLAAVIAVLVDRRADRSLPVGVGESASCHAETDA
jgi:hypothetical protein